MLSLLNDLLDLSKLESGKMEFAFQIGDISRAVECIVDEFTSLLSEKSVSVRFGNQISNTLVNFDATRIKQVVRNLVSNALKFSPENSVISIGLDNTGHSVQITVEDSGLGIPDDELETIFDKFVQSSQTNKGAGEGR